MSYAIQRIIDGGYVAPQWDTVVQEPHQAYLFCSREAAQQYITRELPIDIGWRVATVPDTRPLLSVPGEFKCS